MDKVILVFLLTSAAYFGVLAFVLWSYRGADGESDGYECDLDEPDDWMD